MAINTPGQMNSAQLTHLCIVLTVVVIGCGGVIYFLRRVRRVIFGDIARRLERTQHRMFEWQSKRVASTSCGAGAAVDSR